MTFSEKKTQKEEWKINEKKEWRRIVTDVLIYVISIVKKNA